jgi:hypothetical protein
VAANLPFVLWMVGLSTTLGLRLARLGGRAAAPHSNGRGVRILLKLGAIDMGARLLVIATKVRAIAALGAHAIVMDVLLTVLVAESLWLFIRRASEPDAEGAGDAQRLSSEPWSRWILVAVVMGFLSRNGEAWWHLTWVGGVWALALLGTWLDWVGPRRLASGAG